MSNLNQHTSHCLYLATSHSWSWLPVWRQLSHWVYDHETIQAAHHYMQLKGKWSKPQKGLIIQFFILH